MKVEETDKLDGRVEGVVLDDRWIRKSVEKGEVDCSLVGPHWPFMKLRGGSKWKHTLGRRVTGDVEPDRQVGWRYGLGKLIHWKGE